MADTNKQISAWRGDFGDAYVDRNVGDADRLRALTVSFGCILDNVHGDPPASILEVGANLGNNLAALNRVSGAELFAVEPNAKARDLLAESGRVPAANIFDAVATGLPFEDGAIDLVFTSGVLIHIPEDDLEAAYREMHRVSNKYVLSIEYFAPSPTRIQYRGETDLLFKRDFGGFWLDLFDDLESVANGFLWKRTTGLDDLNWWLLRKR